MALIAPLPVDEDERLEDLYQLHILDTAPEERFDLLVLLVQQIFQTPMAMISLIDKDRQWFKSKSGLTVSETSRDVSFCSHTILHDDIMIVPDAQEDPRFADNPAVQGSSGIRFYAGFPLQGIHKHAIGTLCIADVIPRSFNEYQCWIFKKFARMVQLEIQQGPMVQWTRAAHAPIGRPG